jgi:uncharacterized membrane protein
MRSTLDVIAYWLIDYYVAATLLLVVVALAHRVISQPTRRLALHWGALVGLVLLAVFSLLPSWPRIDVMNAVRGIAPAHRVISQVSSRPIVAGETPDAEAVSSSRSGA